jgi:hypothetical protein
MALMIEIAGWVGSVLILLSYLLLTTGRLTAHSPSYQWMNVVGAAGFVANGLWNQAYPSAALNIVWIGIGATALYRLYRIKHKANT